MAAHWSAPAQGPDPLRQRADHLQLSAEVGPCMHLQRPQACSCPALHPACMQEQRKEALEVKGEAAKQEEEARE